MLNRLMRLAWFLSSYAPLWIILSINNLLFDECKQKIIGASWMSYLFGGLALLPTSIVYLYLNKYQNSSGAQSVEIKSPRIISDLSREYIVTYAISLIGFNLLDIRQAISFCFLIVFFAYLYVKYDTVAYNPILELFGYRMFYATIMHLGLPKNSDGDYLTRENVTIITRQKATALISESSSILPMNADGDLFIQVRKKR